MTENEAKEIIDLLRGQVLNEKELEAINIYTAIYESYFKIVEIMSLPETIFYKYDMIVDVLKKLEN